MKLLHAADLHLDTPFTGHSGEAAQLLRSRLLQVPEQIAQLAREHHCDMLLLSGDLFDGPATAEGLQTLKNALQEVQIPVFISPGNHDFCAPGSPWLTESWPENVHVFTHPRMESISLPQLDCRIYGAGYTSMDCGGLLENFHTDGPERRHIGILHGDPVQRDTPYCPITQSQLRSCGLDYLALGHIHKTGSIRAGSTLCAWPGCPMGRGNDETGEKGVLLVTLEDTVQTRFLPLNTIRFHDLEAEVVSTADETLRSILPAAGSEDFYRITLTGECEPFDASALSFPTFPNLQLRDRTTPPADPWRAMDQDSLEGIYFRMLHDAMEGQDEETVRALTLAAQISRRILDGREVALP